MGDIVGDAGCEHIRKKLPGLKEKYGADIVIANGENAAEGNGILPASVDHLRNSGVDIITTGNHGLRRYEIYDVLEKEDGVLRPENYHPDAPGSGVYFFDNCRQQLCVVNIQGNVYLQSYENAFNCIDRILEDLPTKNIIVDFHAEATSEKVSMGLYLDGRVSAVVGTHTHVPTADAQILPNGSGYITDLGMCGGKYSVLGVQADIAINRLRTCLPHRFKNDKENICLSGVAIEIDTGTGLCKRIENFVHI